MKTQLTQTKINGHGYKKGRVWNLAHLLPRRHLALLPDESPNPQPTAVHSPGLSAIASATAEGEGRPVAPKSDQGGGEMSATPSSQTSSQTLSSTLSVPDSTVQQFSDSTAPPLVDRKSGAPRERVVNPETPPLPSLSPLHSVKSSARTRTGKIARLPDHIRWQVNQFLRQNRKYSDIVQALEKLGYPGFSPQNISNWKFGGFVDWFYEEQLHEERLSALKALDHSARSVDVNRLQQNAIALAADKFMIMMAGFNPLRALEAVHQNPELLPKYIAAMHSLSRCTTELAKSLEISQRGEKSLRHDLFPTDSPEVARLLAQSPIDDDANESAETPAERNQTATPIPSEGNAPEGTSPASMPLRSEATEPQPGFGPRERRIEPHLTPDSNFEALQPHQGKSNLLKPSQTDRTAALRARRSGPQPQHAL